MDSEIVGESIHEALDEATRWLAVKPVAVAEEETNVESAADAEQAPEDGNHNE